MARRFVIRQEATVERHHLSIDYAKELNEQQYAAATAQGGPQLVVAGAGTGKTRTLVYRVAYLVETGAPPEQIVLLTFTRRAAEEMLSRASALLDGRCRRVRGGTFHSFCLGILRQHAGRLDYPNNFTILDASDSADVIDVIRSGLNLRLDRKRFPRKRTIQSIFSSVRNRDMSMEDFLEARYPQFLEFVEVFEQLGAGYERYKQDHGLMDYDDLLIKTLRLFSEHDGVRRSVATECRHVLVDEYQDTNRTQALLVERFSSVHGNVMVVGDDAQSIYRFRGADFRNILSFPEKFPGTQVLKLEHNYRSTQRILDLANLLISRARNKFDKRLFTERGLGETPVLVHAADSRFESRFVSQMILTLREEGVPLSEMAVLFRNGFNSYDIEIELTHRGIPFVKYGGLKLSEAAHIKDLLAYLKVVENPMDGVAWNRILQLLEGIGPKTAHQLISWIESASDRAFEIDESRFSPRYIEDLKRMFAMLRYIRSTDVPITEQVEVAVAYYEPVLRRVYYEDYPKRMQDLEQFVGLAEGFSDRAQLLSSMALDPIELTALDTETEVDDEPPLVLSTIHSAKGLEYRNVFLIRALDGVLPSSHSIGDADALDEELRLLYVAVTRAADQLFISYPSVQYRRSDGQYFTSPSRFLVDISEELLEPGSIVEESPDQTSDDRDETARAFRGLPSPSDSSS